MTDRIIVENIDFPVAYHDASCTLRARLLRPQVPMQAQQSLPPVVFNSGFTGGASMYGQLVGRALAECGYAVMTYDVAGFYQNKRVRNTWQAEDGRTVTEVSLADQRDEVLAALACTREHFGRAPVLASWAMGAVASLAAVIALARAEPGTLCSQVCYYIPMNYTRIAALQNLRADSRTTHAVILALPGDATLPPFDTGTAETRLGYYPLDPDTQTYVDQQLGGYTDVEGVERWPGCTWVSARSYQDGVRFDPEADLGGIEGARLPPALIFHGARNTLHSPDESLRLHRVWPGAKTAQAVLVDGMAHGQEMAADHPVFRALITRIDQGIRAALA